MLLRVLNLQSVQEGDVLGDYGRLVSCLLNCHEQIHISFISHTVKVSIEAELTHDVVEVVVHVIEIVVFVFVFAPFFFEDKTKEQQE